MNNNTIENMMREGMSFEEIIKAAENAESKIKEEKAKIDAEEAAAKEAENEKREKNLSLSRRALAYAMLDYMEIYLDEEFSEDEFEKFCDEIVESLKKEENYFNKLINFNKLTDFLSASPKKEKEPVSLLAMMDKLDSLFNFM